jgi:hypothetical protein
MRKVDTSAEVESRVTLVALGLDNKVSCGLWARRTRLGCLLGDVSDWAVEPTLHLFCGGVPSSIAPVLKEVG